MTVTLAHGFTQTKHSWGHVASLLTQHGVESIRPVDLPGHGDAGGLRTDLWGSADHLVHAGGPGTYIGYSMGARVTLHAALAHPHLVQRMALIGVTPGIVDDTERAQRRSADERLADRIIDIGVEAFIDAWLTNPLFAGLDDETAQRSDRLTNTAAGLASSLRLAGTGTQTPLWDRLREITAPVLLIVGEHDEKFRMIAETMADLLPDVTMAVIAGSGHTTHLEQPERTADAIARWHAAARAAPPPFGR